MATGEKLHSSIWSKDGNTQDGNRKTADEVLSALAFAAFREYPILRQTLEAPKRVEEGKQWAEVLILGSGPSEEDPDDILGSGPSEEDPDDILGSGPSEEDPDDKGSTEVLESVWIYEFWL